MRVRDRNYSLLIDDWGEPTNTKRVSPETLDKYSRILPPNVIQYWREEGFCQFRSGQFFSVNPEDWDVVVDSWLIDTPYESFGKFHALTRGAFGKVFVFNEVIGATTTIDPIVGSVFSYKTEAEDERERTISAGMAFSLIPSDLDFRDDQGEYLFGRALAKLGPVGWDEMYAFEPALALGGAPRLETLVKVDWRVHMSLLRQMTDVHVPFTDINVPKGTI